MSFLTRKGKPTLHAYKETKQTSLSYQKRRNISRKSTVEMDFSKHKTMKRVEMDFSMTTQEPVEQVKAMQMVIMTVLTMIQTTICPTLTTVEVSLQEQVWDHGLLTRKMHHRCPEKLLSTIDISAAKMTKPAKQRPWSSSHANHSHHARIVSQEVRLRSLQMH